MWPLLGKFLLNVAEGVVIAGVSSYLWGDTEKTPIVVSPTNYYYPTQTARTVQLNNHFTIAPPPPNFNRDSAIASYTQQFVPIQLPSTAEDFLSKKYYSGGSQKQGATLKIIQAERNNDKIEFGYRLMLTEQTYEGKGYFLPGTGELNLGLEAYGIKPGMFGKFKHVRSNEILNFIYLPAVLETDKLQFINNDQP